MRIVYLHQYFNTVGMIGGTRSFELARRLVARGHDVHMVTSRRDAPQASPVWLETEEHGIHVHWLPVPYENAMRYRARLDAFRRFAWAAAGRARHLGGDVVFATSTPLTIALPGVYATRRNRVPMVLEVRDVWPEVPIAIGALRDPVSRSAARWLERFAYRHASRIVALSPDMRNSIARRGYPPERITVIPNASDVELFDVGPDPGRALRERYPWLGDRPLVLYAGTLGMVNGLSYLARVAAETSRIDPEVRFVVIGQGREEELVRRTAAELGVLDRSFFMLGSMPKSEIPAWLSAADLATSTVIDLPALHANSANKVFDAFAAATPIAINHEGWLADLIRETRCGLVLPARNHREAAQRVVSAVSDRAWLDTAGDAARSLASDRFNRDRLAGDLERVLLDASADPARTSRLVPVKGAARSRETVGGTHWVSLALKRGIDLVLGALALVLTVPILALSALLIVREDGRPVLYRQRRAGRHNKPFDVLKLRTMRLNTLSVLDVCHVDEEHPLVTQVGRTLRRFKIDELLQFVHVLRGQMSVVGPRPVAVEVVDGFGDFERRRLEMRPGITGWAQINGGVQLTWDERNALDVWYVDHWSLWLDMKILARTLSVVVLGERTNRRALETALAYVGRTPLRTGH